MQSASSGICPVTLAIERYASGQHTFLTPTPKAMVST
ncbi:hypothetical protein PS639_04163 [Pseudomonas fluorescens]|nr:hypothetical protein PS639_04163 [Pseudomonas fluorescens]